MSWEDIDFGLIVPGMITRGPAAVSFADYLNQFSRALDERLNMLIETPDGNYPTLPNIEFEVGEIRTGTDSDFWVKLKSMIQQYYLIWNSYDWYSVELMTDPVNHEDYLLEDADLIAAITQETFDIISDVDNKFILEYFTAAVLNALYEIYKLTQYTTVRMQQERFGVFNPSWGVSTVNGQENVGPAGAGTDPGDDNFTSFFTANSAAYGRYGIAYNAAGSIGNNSPTIAEITTQTTRTPIGPEGDDEWNTSYSQSINGISLHSRYRDLNDVLLDMEVNTYLQVSVNWKLYQFPDFTGNGIPYGPYNADFDQITVDDQPIEYNSTALFLGTIHQEPKGTVNTWAGNGGTYGNLAKFKQISVFTDNRPEGELYEDNQFFRASLRSKVATNINNPGLEFFIG